MSGSPSAQNENEGIGVLIKTTLVDFPETVACSFFLRGCNMHCPYCYNIELVAGSGNGSLSTKEELFAYLEKRKNVLHGLAVSGGEALLSPHLTEILSRAKKLGYKTKLDTNGMLPETLLAVIKNKDARPNFIALDLKTAPSRYAEELFQDGTSAAAKNAAQKLLQSVEIISDYPASQREFRTVLVPRLVEENDLQEIARILPADASWMLAPFQNGNCLCGTFSSLPPYSDARLNELTAFAKQFIPGAQLR